MTTLATETIYLLQQSGIFSSDGTPGMQATVRQKCGESRAYKIIMLDADGARVGLDIAIDPWSFVAGEVDSDVDLISTIDVGGATLTRQTEDAGDYLLLTLEPSADAMHAIFRAKERSNENPSIWMEGEISWESDGVPYKTGNLYLTIDEGVSGCDPDTSGTPELVTTPGERNIALTPSAQIDPLDLFKTYARVPFAGTGIDPTGVADSTAGIQALVDTGLNFLALPGTTYRITAPISCTTSGQELLGASMSSCVINVDADCEAFIIQPHSNENIANAIGAIPDSNQVGRIYGWRIVHTGEDASTKAGIRVAPREIEEVGDTDWNAEGWTIEQCTWENFHTGLQVKSASKFSCINCHAKGCLQYGADYDDTTNNAPLFLNFSCSQTPEGMKINGMQGGVITLGDFAANTIGIRSTNSNFTCSGGRLESYSDCFHHSTDSRIMHVGGSFASPAPPMRLYGRASATVYANAWSWSDGPRDVEAFAVLDANTATVSGNNGGTLRYSNRDDMASQVVDRVLCADGQIRTICPIPWTSDSVSTQGVEMDGLASLEYGTRGSDMRITLVNGDGDPYLARVAGSNLLVRDLSDGSDHVGGWESFIEKSAGSVILREPDYADYGVSSENGWKFVVRNTSDTNTVTVSPFNASVLLNGDNASIGIQPNGSATVYNPGHGLDWTVQIH